MSYVLRRMEVEDILDVVRNEELVFGHSLGYDMFVKELTDNVFSRYNVMYEGSDFIGYMGLWIMGEEAQIINFLIAPFKQGKGYGKILLDNMILLCQEASVMRVTLEVRENNSKARRIYEKYGFYNIGVRPRYYKNGDNALVMMKEF